MASETNRGETSRAFGAGDPWSGLIPDAALWTSFGVDLPFRLSAEILSFAARRLQAQSEHVAAIGRCKSPVEALKLQLAFVTRAVSEYQREAGTLSQDVADSARPARAA
ncbi:hypothetical protein M446_5724 [Methylobacterium sp. 4-46]|uniref:phasin family protein n=1 Tax=unclassified Methylobacterium TaxID=2615210 RepID=UPI000152D2D6|nr:MULTISPECIES: phasin family protein [Methylobacterium]ACA20013.1 hypothetical protein M446_5724 [Methylobacterium sp. 4-46]WFT79201.1 phasin family protein [Methylobacterium nodulans]